MSGVQSIERAFALLRALALGPAGVTDLADRTGLPKSTAARLLSALLREGAVERTETGGHYRLGGELLELAQAGSADRSLIATARPFLTELTEVTGEVAGIAILEGNEVRYLDSVQSDEEVQVRDWTGEALPFNIVASGFVLAAGLGPEGVDELLAGPLPASTDRSLTEPAAIRRRLDEIRRTGHVWGCGEYDEGINSVAAPVLDGRGSTVAALHIHGPAYRFPQPGSEDATVALLGDAARRLSKRLT
jgi:DNA-binding IclR family transcriptional regulator